MPLKPRIVSYQPAGRVLAVPDSAVVDTGLRKIVFVETMPGMFDGVELVLGPRCENSYPVVSGLEAGQRVAVAGAFLLDAETRLNPSLASSYFGAGGGSQTAASANSVTVSAATDDRLAVSNLDPADRKIAERQRICPVTRKVLGSMGTPVRMLIAGRVVFLCCSGCKDAIQAAPARYLAVLDANAAP
jgi:hypothetical protein